MMWYVFKSVVFLSAMYVPYLLMLRRESFFRFNRSVLLGIMVLSLALPFVTVQLPEGMPEPVGAVLLPVHEVMAGEAVQTQGEVQVQAVDGQDLMLGLYLVGLLAALLYKGVQLVALQRRIRIRVLWTEEREGATVYCHADDVAPYSWMHSIVISQRDYETHPREILLHEMGHVRCGHSWDVLLLNVVQIVQWFNPLAWLMGSSLRDVHEYEADNAVVSGGVDARQYQLLLVCKAAGSGENRFANGFSHSSLSKRIQKMAQQKSNPWLRLKVLAVMAVATVGVFAFAESKGFVVENAVQAVKENVTTAVAPSELQNDTVYVVSEVDEEPCFSRGSYRKEFDYFAKHMKFPEEAKKVRKSGRAPVKFVVRADGSITDVELIRGLRKCKDMSLTPEQRAAQDAAAEAMNAEALRLVKSMPKWIPGKKNGKPVHTKTMTLVVFRSPLEQE